MNSVPAPTEDRILGGRIVLRQPAGGYRTALDPVLLAASVRATPGGRVLDLGTGTGAVALCLLARVPDLSVTGVEIEPEIAALARANAAANALADRMVVITGDLTERGLVSGSFDHVAANPPFHAERAHRAPADAAKARAHLERPGTLPAWLGLAAGRLRSGGDLTLIHKADRLADVLGALPSGFGAVRLRALYPRAGEAANRILLRAVKGSRTPLSIAPPLVVHEADGRWSPEIGAALGDGAALAL